ncbi:excalibur calcium-binding domain-containing protein [Gordonia sp. (in: high G+C Gram-positive bacteria)]|uniref:excalibur calcium-binding domain-containing protein n=1 Tax=Gordonia sp. (in: high G+C Gram-positive bacteria) TaxID=84139 RepID=UPI003F95BBC5
MTWQQPAQKNSKRTAAFGIGGLFALLASCGIGAAIGGEDAPDAAPPVTTTITDVATETVTETPTTSRAAATTEETTTAETTEPVDVDEPDTTPPVRLVPTTVQEVVPTEDGGSTYYANCSAARAAGAAPVHAGDPGYGDHLDRDGDGVGCE